MKSFSNLTWFNRLYVVLWLLGALWCASQGVWGWAVACALIPVLTLATLVFGKDSESIRISGAQPADERDARAIEWAFAAIGKVAIFASTAAFILVVADSTDGSEIRLEAIHMTALAPFMVVFTTWAIAHFVALRKF